MIGERHVNDAALSCRHRLHGHRAAGGHGPVGHAHSHSPEHLVPALAVAFHVQRDIDPPVALAAEHEVQQELERCQRLAAAADEQAGVFSVDVQRHR
jgi:hypothetical protein